MVTHDPEDAARIADEVIGVVVGQALPPRLARDFLNDPPAQMRNYFTR
jgi:thiamine transport system ATP-binding protein